MQTCNKVIDNILQHALKIAVYFYVFYQCYCFLKCLSIMGIFCLHDRWFRKEKGEFSDSNRDQWNLKAVLGCCCLTD